MSNLEARYPAELQTLVPDDAIHLASGICAAHNLHNDPEQDDMSKGATYILYSKWHSPFITVTIQQRADTPAVLTAVCRHHALGKTACLDMVDTDQLKDWCQMLKAHIKNAEQDYLALTK